MLRTSRPSKVFLGIVAALTMLLPAMLVVNMVSAGIDVISPTFFFSHASQGGRAGGIAAVIVSTGVIILIAMLVAVPIGLTTAVAIYRQHHSSWVKRTLVILDILYSVPSVVFGLFGYALFVRLLGLGYSLLAGGLAMAFMLLPMFVKIAYQSLLATPAKYRFAGDSLKISFWGFVRRILLPTALPGLITAFILSCGRGLSETAVLLFTAGYVLRMPQSVMDSGRTLSVHIFDLAMNVPGGMRYAAATASVLFMLVLLFNLTARWIGQCFLVEG